MASPFCSTGESYNRWKWTKMTKMTKHFCLWVLEKLSETREHLNFGFGVWIEIYQGKEKHHRQEAAYISVLFVIPLMAKFFFPTILFLINILFPFLENLSMGNLFEDKEWARNRPKSCWVKGASCYGVDFFLFFIF